MFFRSSRPQTWLEWENFWVRDLFPSCSGFCSLMSLDLSSQSGAGSGRAAGEGRGRCVLPQQKARILRYCWLPWRAHAPFCEWSVPLPACFTVLISLHIGIWVSDDARAFWLPAPLHKLLLHERQPLAFPCRVPVSLWAFPCGGKALRAKSPPTVTG